MCVCVCALSERNTPFCHTESATQIISDPCHIFSNGMLIPDVWNADVFHWKTPLTSQPFDVSSQFNFVGRILGPRGLTAKQLEAETGCKIMVRGKSSMRDKKKVRHKSNNSIHFLLLLFKLYPLYLIFNFCSGFPFSFFLAFVVCLYVWTKWCGIPLFFFFRFKIEGLVGHVFIAFFFFFCEVDHILPLRQHITNRRQMERDKIQALPFE